MNNLKLLLNKINPIATGQILQTVCKPLINFLDIKNISYVRVYSDNTLIYLNTSQQLPLFLFKNNIFTLSIFDKALSTNGLIFEDNIDDNNMEVSTYLEIIKKEFGLFHGISLCDSTREYIDIFTCHVAPEYNDFADIYITNISYIKDFVSFFKCRLNSTIETIKVYKLSLGAIKSINNKSDIFIHSDNKDTINQLLTNKYKKSACKYLIGLLSEGDNAIFYLDPPFSKIAINTKELILLIYLSMDYSYKQIAKCLGLSWYTIKDRTDLLIDKLGCKNKKDLTLLLKNHYIIENIVNPNIELFCKNKRKIRLDESK